MFTILRISSGWIMGEMKNASQKHFFDYSYLTNFIEDIMKALLYVHGDWAQDEPVNHFKAVWEPAMDMWEMTLTENTLSIDIKHYNDMEGKEYREQSNYEFNYYEFLEAFIMTMKDMLNKYGLLGYRESWGYEFPISLLVKLLDISRKSGRIKLGEITKEDNLGLEASKTDIDVEVALVNELLACNRSF